MDIGTSISRGGNSCQFDVHCDNTISSIGNGSDQTVSVTSPEQCSFFCDADAACGTVSFTAGVSRLYDNVVDGRWVFLRSPGNAAGKLL
jgi:hypothetical protein